MNPILSIIIPCYNSEATLETTLESVMNQDFQDWEAIIVNDGSTDATEKIALGWVKKDTRFKYYAKQNEGLGKTRNYGIARSKGLYILPLDSDNLLEKDFVTNAIAVFENDSSVGIVYGDAEYCGDKTGLWKVDEFKLEKILIENYIDACAIYRKKLWVEVGGYDENMPHQGHEDWELWIALGSLKVEFHHLNKITFKYYVSEDSMIRSFTDEMVLLNQDYIVKKYSRLYHKSYVRLYEEFQKREKVHSERMKSKKIVFNLFTKMFIGIVFFDIKDRSILK